MPLPRVVLLVIAVQKYWEREARLDPFLHVRAELPFIILKPDMVLRHALVVLLYASLEAAVVLWRLVEIRPVSAVLPGHDFVDDLVDDDVLRMLAMVMHIFHGVHESK